jgi:hypothetical protein
MHSVDYPFGSSADGKAFMESLRASGMVSEGHYLPQRQEAFEDINKLGSLDWSEKCKVWVC